MLQGTESLHILIITILLGAVLVGAASRWLWLRKAAESRARQLQSRLDVVASASVAGGRWLVMVRRDNIEHLLLIGGASDVVVEPNIMRARSSDHAPPPAREVSARVSKPERPAQVAVHESGSYRPGSTPRLAIEDATLFPLQPRGLEECLPNLPEQLVPKSELANADEREHLVHLVQRIEASVRALSEPTTASQRPEPAIPLTPPSATSDWFG